VSYAAGTTVSYYINSEGTELHAPHTYASIRINAQAYDKHSASISEGITFDGIELSELPSEPELLKACTLIKQRLEAQGKLDTIPENYTGPILFEGESAMDFFRNYFFTGKNTLIASREEFQDEATREMPKQNDNDEQKYNKKIFSKELTVEDCPNLKEYNGVKLIGSYSIDAEGIKPKDNLLLVENGVLRNMLNNRIPTPGQTEPNGHCRFYSTMPTTEVLPGVLKITASEGKSIGELKKALILEADERGLDYAIVLKPCFIGKFNCGNQYYRLNVADGKEELIHSGIYRSDRFNNGKKERILGLSEGVVVKNDFYIGSNSPIISYIVPDGVLIESAEYSFSQGNDKTIIKQYVPFPPIATKDYISN